MSGPLNPTVTRWRDTAWLVALGLVLFLPGIGARDLWNPDEPRYAEVAREMLASGQYLIPHLNGEVYVQKPPLQFWAMAASARILGRMDETAARLPAVLAACAALVLVHRMGERLFGRRAAWIAVAAFATCSRILWQGRIGQIDMLLVALVAAAVWFWVRAWTEERPGLALGFFFFAALANMAKGPVGLLPPLFGILLFLAWTRDREGLRRLRLGRGLLLWAGLAVLWLAAAYLVAGPEYLDQLAFRQTVTRYAEPWHHLKPWYYYLSVVPGDFFPWSLLLPAALVAGWRGLEGRRRAGFRFAHCWAVATLVFFSLSPAKRTVYVLTMYPALALLVGAGLDALAEAWPRHRRWLTWPLGALSVLLAAAAAVVPSQAQRSAAELEALGRGVVAELVVLVLVLAAAAAVAAWQAHAGRVAGAAAILAVAMGTVAVGLTVRVLPRFDAVKSARPLAEILSERMLPGESYAVYPTLEAAFVFYTGKFCERPASETELRAYAARPERVWLLIRKRELERLAPPLPLVEVARDRDERHGYVLLTTPNPASRPTATDPVGVPARR